MYRRQRQMCIRDRLSGFYTGEGPMFDETILTVECAEREDWYGENQHNPERERLQKKLADERAERKAKRAKVVSQGSIFERPNCVVFEFDKPPAQDDLDTIKARFR